MRYYKYVKILIIIIIFTILTGNSIIADDQCSGGKAGASLRIPIGARSAGLGNAFTGIADDINAPFFNPAGLSQIHNVRLGAMYNIMTVDRNHYYATMILGKNRRGSLAFIFSSYGVSDIIEVLPGGEITGDTFNSNEMIIGISAGTKLLPLISVGATTKYITNSIHDNKGSSFAFDFGAMLIIPKIPAFPMQRIRAGASISNIAGKIKWDTDSDHEDEIPVTLRIGSSCILTILPTNLLISAEISQTLDYEKDEKNDFKLHLGAETWLMQMLGIRAGLDGEDLNFGASLRIMPLCFDYAYTPDFLDEGPTHKLGIQINL